MWISSKIVMFVFTLLLPACTSGDVKNGGQKFFFDDSNYRRELKFKVNNKEIDGYGIAEKSPFGYTVEATVSDEIFRGFIRSCNGTKKLELEKERWKGRKKFKSFVPVLSKPFDTPCLIEIFLFSGDGLHQFGMFETKGDHDMLFKSSCNYQFQEKKGTDLCHSSSGDFYFFDAKGKSIRWFHMEFCPEPELLTESKWQILITPQACTYIAAHKLFGEKARISIIGWNDIFMREVF